MSQPEAGWLVLETGHMFNGRFLGGIERAGEVVFNTSHSGYEEMSTDPSYFNQILVMTAPMQGNYGDNDSAWESSRVHIQALVCMEMQNSQRDAAWKSKLISYGVPILSEVDTRSLVLYLREKGTLWGAVVKEPEWQKAQQRASHFIVAAQNMEKDWPFMVAERAAKEIKGHQKKGPRVAVMDFGCKQNIIRELLKRCSLVCVFPPRTSAEEILKWKPHGLLLSNGPGDPAEVKQAVETVQSVLGKFFIFGICMGHQILALALGANTYRLKFGHRGSNHPVKDKLLKTIYVTSQNHGYAVEKESLPPDVQATHTNLNDGTIEGFFSKTDKCIGIQFHPESHPGPHDAVNLFDFFIKQLKKKK
ncbi:MAG: glutamine-hydrolyzing carbamoyl-phosphate synthase small subunit [Oligoflexia bacterium]|nr:glutamine-hydrolyzing carbamoyl-phosphate synthase small subunit [Oligoflexia bacterium]